MKIRIFLLLLALGICTPEVFGNNRESYSRRRNKYKGYKRPVKNTENEDFLDFHYGAYTGIGASEVAMQKENFFTSPKFSFVVGGYGEYNLSHRLGLLLSADFLRAGGEARIGQIIQPQTGNRLLDMLIDIGSTAKAFDITQYKIRCIPKMRIYFGRSRWFFLTFGIGVSYAIKTKTKLVFDKDTKEGFVNDNTKQEDITTPFNIPIHIGLAGFELANGITFTLQSEVGILKSVRKKYRTMFLGEALPTTTTVNVGWNITKVIG